MAAKRKSKRRIKQGKFSFNKLLKSLVVSALTAFIATTGKSWVHWHLNSAKTKAGPPISYEELVRRTGLYLLPDLSGK